MNYSDLKSIIDSPKTSANTTDEELINHFKEKFPIVPYNGDIMFMFNHDREFRNQNHIISLHERNSGKVPMHIFHYIVMTYVYSGQLTITVEDRKVTLNQGDVIIFDKHVPHSVEKTSNNDLGINIILNDNYFSRRFINHLPDNQLITQFLLELMNHQQTHNHYLIFYTQKDYLIHNCIQNILCEHYDHTISSDEIIDNYIMILITHLARKNQYNSNLTTNSFKNQELMNDILQYIKNNYQDGNLKNMCYNFGYDPSYTSKLIKQFSGKTFKQLVNEERMKNAAMLLQNKNITIYEIASQVGISNLTSFYKRFKDYFGCNPQEFRDNKKEVYSEM